MELIKKKEPLNTDLLTILYSSLTAAFFTMFICCQSSPLYPMSEWVDANAEMTMGKAVLMGKVPYLDIYDHRGVLLHLIYAFAALISDSSFAGLFIVEVAAFSVFLFYSGRIAYLYLRRIDAIPFIILSNALLVVSSQAFVSHGSPEELMLPMLSVTLFYILRAIKSNRFLYPREIIISGFAAGCIFWVKYTILGFYIGAVLFIIIWELFYRKNVRELIHSALLFLLGFCLISAPVLLYLLYNRALGGFFDVYIYDNIFNYQQPVTFLYKLKRLVFVFLNIGMSFDFAFLVISVIGIWLLNEMNHLEKAFIILAWVCTFLTSCFLSVYHTYYRLTLFAFFVFGLIVVVKIAQGSWIFNFFKNVCGFVKKNEKYLSLIILLSVICIFGLIYIGILLYTLFNGNLKSIIKNIILLVYIVVPSLFIGHRTLIGKNISGRLWIFGLAAAIFTSPFVCSRISIMQYKKDDYPQYQFAQIINQKPNSTLLCYNMLDAGFYWAAGKVPDFKYFYMPNLVTNEMMDETRGYIEQGLADFVVTPADIEFFNIDSSRYELVECTQFDDFFDYKKFYLYRLK